MAQLPLSFARLLVRLQEGERIAKSEFRPASLLKRFVDDQILQSIRLGKNRKIIQLPNPQILEHYLSNHFYIQDLSRYLQTLENPDAQKADFVRGAGNSKLKAISTFRGLLVKSLRPIQVYLNGSSIDLHTPPGSSWFIEADQEFVPDPDFTIVGIENYENFRLIHEQQTYFSSPKLLFVYRYSPDVLQNWLSSLANPYLHFGDWDPAGLCIYREEYRHILGKKRCQLFIPQNIEDLLIQYGNSALYDQQFSQAKRLTSDEDPQLQALIQLLHQHKKGVEQEILIQNRIL